VFLAQAPLGLTLAAVSLLALATLHRLAAGSRAVLKDNFESVLAVERMKESLERLDSAALLLLAGEKEKGLALAEEHQALFETALQEEEGNVTEAGEAEAAERIRLRWMAYRGKIGRLAALGAGSRRFYFSEMEPLFQEMKTATGAILAMNQEAIRRKDRRVKRLADHVGGVMTGAATAGLLVGLLLSSALISRVLRPLRVLGHAVRRIGEGDWDARVRMSGHDELTALARDVNAMAEKLAQYRESSLGDLLAANHAAQSAIDALPEPVVVFGADGAIRNVNQAAVALGIDVGPMPTHEEMKPVREALDKARDHVLSGRGATPTRGHEQSVRARISGEERHYLPHATPLYEAGRIIGAAVVLQDVTRLRRVEELKTDWVATVAHEFKTPLTSLRMAVHLCLEGIAGPMTEKQADLLQAGREDCERLQTLVDELLDLSRLQTGKIELRRKPLGVEDLLREAVKAHKSRAEAKEISLRCVGTVPEAPAFADPERAPLVLSNLVANALRHTPMGGAVELRGREEDGFVRIEVADTGPGVPLEHRSRIFEKFYQVPGSGGGAGMGLFIAREIVAAHGGQIGVESGAGGGSVFWFTLPLKT
jgi:signal transduction histidine kinase/HAMP domain-containing protein